MGFFKKYYKEILFVLFMLGLFFFLRLTNITHLPMFTDEAIYTRWSQIAKQDANWRFISLTDGKQPMFVWFDMIVMYLIHNPLLAGRIVSVFAGLATTIGLFFLSLQLFKNRWVALLTSFVYVVYPFGLVYDRMALYDSMVGAFTVWCLYLEILLVRKVRLDIGLIFGLVLGAAMLTKTNADFNAAMLPFTLVLFDFKHPQRVKRFFLWVLYAGIAVMLAEVYYSVLRLSPFFYIIAEKNATFAYPLKDWIHHPFVLFKDNLIGLSQPFFIYFTWLSSALVLFAFIIKRSLTKEKLLLLAWGAAPFFAFALIGRTIFPRYILFMTLTLLPLLALSIYWITSRIKAVPLKVLIVILVMGMYVNTDRYILFDFAHAPIPSSDLEQYINSWPAGGGVNEMVSYFKAKSANDKIFVGSEGTFGSVPTLGLEIYLDQDKNIEKQGFYPVKDTMPELLAEKAKVMPTYFIFYHTQTPPFAWPVKFVAKYRQGIGDWYLSIYQVENKAQ